MGGSGSNFVMGKWLMALVVTRFWLMAKSGCFEDPRMRIWLGLSRMTMDC